MKPQLPRTIQQPTALKPLSIALKPLSLSKAPVPSLAMAPAKLACLNAGDNAEYTYTGKENTPQGLGYAAGPEMVGKMMKGRDGAVYMVIMKNREKTWKKIPEDMAERMQKEMPLLTKAVSEVREAVEPSEETKEKPATAEPEVPKAEDEEETKPEEKGEVSKPVEEKEKKPRKPRAKKEAEPKVEGEEETKPQEEGDAEPKPVEKKPRKPRAKKEAEPKVEGEEVKEKKERKPRAKKEAEPKVEGEEEGEVSKPVEEKEKKPRKPRAKKEAGEEGEVKEKKERKPRAPTEYNKFLGEKITELRASEPGKKNTEYMQMAIALWRAKKEAEPKAEDA